MSNAFAIEARSSARKLSPIFGRLLFLLVAALLVPSVAPSLGAQDGKAGKAADEPPQQIGLSEFTEPFQHADDPPFAYHIPAKKKFKKYTDRFRKVDLEARRKVALENVEKALEAEEAKSDKDEMRLNELKVQKGQITNFYDRTKLLLEVEGDPSEWIRIQLVPMQDTRIKIEDVQPRGEIERRWKRVEVQYDKDTTSKADQKKNRQSHSLMLTGTPENSTDAGWWRFETRLIPSKDETKLFQLSYVHRMDASKFGKKTMKDAELLSRFWLVP